MNHGELLAKLDALDHSCSVVGVTIAALRAVVELHTADFGTPGEDIVCDYCKITYPCPTIQAIEKELK